MELNTNNTNSFQIFTSKQLQAASLSLNVIDSIRETFKAIAQSCDFSNKTHMAKVSYARLAERTGFSERTVKYHVNTLIKLGVIDRERTGYIDKKTGQRRQTANHYYFNLDVILNYCAQLSAGIKSVTKTVRSVVRKKTLHPHIAQVVTTDKPPQLNNIKRTAILAFTSIKAMFSRKTQGQYIDTQTGLLFASFDDRHNYANAIGYVPSRSRSRLIYDAIMYCRKNNPTELLDQAWLTDLESKIKAIEITKPVIDYQFYTSETQTHKYHVGKHYFLNKESRQAIIERDRSWKQ